MAKRSFEWVRGYERDLIDKDEKLRNPLFKSIWNMVNLVWDFDEKTKAKLGNVRTLVETSPANAVQNASIALSNTAPRWEVSPYGSSLFEIQRAENLERCLEWDFYKLNTRGTGTLLYDMARSSIMYDMIAVRVDDLEYQFKGVKNLSTLQKYIRSKGRFIAQCYDPRSIHLEYSMGTYTAVLRAEELRAWDVYNYWKMYEGNTTAEGAMVRAALSKMDDKFANKKQNEINAMKFVMYEFISHDQILKHGHFIGNADQGLVNSAVTKESSANDIIFADEDNKLGFINWSIRVGGSRMESEPAYQVNPMLAPLHWGNSWETLNILKSLILSEPVKRMLEEPRELHVTRDGKPLPVNEDGVASGFTGEEIKKLPPSPLDPNAPAVVQTLQEEMVKVTGANILSDVTSAKTTPFATLNAMIQVAMSRLDINRRDMGLASSDIGQLFMRWGDVSKVPLHTYRWGKRRIAGGMLEQNQGEQIVVTSDDYDADFCEINVDIKPKTPTDLQQQILMAIQLHEKLQVPIEYVLQNMVGLDNTELLKNQYQDEMFETTEFQTALQNIATQEAMRIQQQAQQQQMQQQPAAQPPESGGGISEEAFGSLGGGQGVNPAMMGASTSNFAPGMTRETITGQTQGGQPTVF